MHPDLPPLTALYAQRARLLTNRRPARDIGNVAGVAGTSAWTALRRAARTAWRVIFRIVAATCCGLCFGVLIEWALTATR